MPRRTAATADPSSMSPQEIANLVNGKWPGAMKFASDEEFVITKLPTGILSIDIRMKGGFARGRHTEIFGGFNLGKTYLTYRLIAETQRNGGVAAFVDAEGTFDPAFATLAGVDLDSLALHRQQHAEGVVDFVETLLRIGAHDVIVVDSIASLLPKSELEKTMSDGSMGTEQAKLMSKALRKLTAANSKTVLVYINQTREAVGVMFGSRSITSGGKAMGFYAATRLELVKTDNIKRTSKRINPANGEVVRYEKTVGHRVLVRVAKEKTGSANQADETTFVFNYQLGGIDHTEDLMYLGRQYGIIHKSGTNWWVDGYKEDKVVGRARMLKYLRTNTVIAEELEELIREAAASTTEIEEDAETDE